MLLRKMDASTRMVPANGKNVVFEKWESRVEKEEQCTTFFFTMSLIVLFDF